VKIVLPASLRSFGEIGVVTTKDKIQGKLKNRGTPCMVVDYSANHAHDVYRKLNFETEMIINLRGIIWLNQVHKELIIKTPNNQPNYDDDDGGKLMIQSVNNQPNYDDNDGMELMIQSVNTDQNAPEDLID
jgi:hypothetical protein